MPLVEGVLATVLTAAALLLGIAGVTKLVRPDTTATALRTAGLPSGAGPVRAIGLLELALAVWFGAIGGRPAALAVGGIHLAFAVFSSVLRRRDPSADCGCFGRATPVTILHIVVNGAVAAAAAASGLLSRGATESVIREAPWPPIPTALAVAAGIALLHTALTARIGTDAHPGPPPPGRTVPTELVGVSTADGSPVSRPLTGHDGDALLLFLSPSCLTCRGIWRELAGSRRPVVPPTTELIVVVPADEDPTRLGAPARRHLRPVAIEAPHERWGVPGDPWAILIDRRSGRVRAEGTGATWRELSERMFTVDPSAR